jgi:DNA polymerase-1
MILQVHDELVFDALKEESEIIQPIIIDCMRSALPLPNDVPVEAEIGAGQTWLTAH